ncbi:MAG: dihydrofolate reductase family protein [Ktedonobacterales bacterium]
MHSLQSLYERSSEPDESLPPALAALYGGGLAMPDALAARPYVLANLVSTLDGVVSYNSPGESGGGPISGESEEDHMVMGLLRARADAVLFGAGSLHGDSGHVRTPAFIYPALANEYAAYRARLGLAELPLNVVVSGSGRVDLREPTFHTRGLRVLIATTAAGAIRLARETLPTGVEVRAVSREMSQPEDGDGSPIPMKALLALLRRDYGVRVALTEGGPRLLASFVAAGLLD